MWRWGNLESIAPGTFSQFVGKNKIKSQLASLGLYSLLETLQVVPENCFCSNTLHTLRNIVRLDGNHVNDLKKVVLVFDGMQSFSHIVIYVTKIIQYILLRLINT